MKAEESILIKNIQAGNKAVFEVLYKEYYLRLVRFANGFLFDIKSSEGVVQDLFLKLWENREKIDIQVSLASYLFTSTKNLSLKVLSKVKVEDRNMLFYLQGLIDAQMCETSGTDHEEDLLNELERAITKLPEGIKEIILLKYESHKKITEIAEILGVSQNTVKTQLQRGKEKLKNSISKSRGINFIL